MKVKEDMLFNIQEDPEETISVKNKNPEVFRALEKLVMDYNTIKPNQKVPSYQKGREDFIPPEEWNIDVYHSPEKTKELN